MDCPVCKVELKMAERQGVEIDYCPQCRGIWLDRGELDKIIERSLSSAPREYGEEGDREEDHEHHSRDPHEHQDDYSTKRRKKSFLKDLLDF